jgi:uncharacterized protein
VIAFTLLLSLVAMMATLCTSRPGSEPPSDHQLALLPTTTIAIGGVPVRVEIADGPAERAQGLSFRDGLASGTGMLFVFREPRTLSFWMKDMRFCLDIVWIEDAAIQGTTTNVCPTKVLSDADLPKYGSPTQVSYVLEVPAGWVAANGFGTGTPVENLPPLSAT